MHNDVSPTESADETEIAFTQLIEAVQCCQMCPRMEGRLRVLSRRNGPVSARLVFVAEAPGRFGADACGVPLSGDRTGRTFEELLVIAGLKREDVFVTNAVLCNPRDSGGRNDKPYRSEIANCGRHLVRLLQILDPEWVVTLGNIALQATGRIEPHNLVLSRHVGQPVRWFGRWLVPMYHPAPRALLRRSIQVQRADYVHLAGLLSVAGFTTDDANSNPSSGSGTESVI